MTGIWIESWLENNKVVSFKTVLIPLTVRSIHKILSASVIKLNALLTQSLSLLG